MVALRTCQPVRNVIMGVFNPKLDEYRWISIDAVPVFPRAKSIRRKFTRCSRTSLNANGQRRRCERVSSASESGRRN